MFTGIIETTGVIKDIITNGSNKTFTIESSIAHELKTDQSVAHNGVCLTVEAVLENAYMVTAIEETLHKTTLGQWQIGDVVNIERCLAMKDRIDGHIVQGHVDTTATCTQVITKEGSTEYEFDIDKKYAALIIEKGSISLNGISLTIFNVTTHQFMVAVIPYTFHHTNMQYVKAGDIVNIEFDILGKYILRAMEVRQLQ